MNWPRRRGAVWGVAMSLAVGLLAGCGSGGPKPSTPVRTESGVGVVIDRPDGVQEITIQTQDNYAFTPDRFTVAPGKIRLTVTNVAKELTHNFRFTPGKGPEAISAEIPLLAPGQKETIEFTVTTPGQYAFECSFHVQLHQVGTMTVRG